MRDCFRVTAVAHIVISERYSLRNLFFQLWTDILPFHRFFKAEREHLYLEITPCKDGSHFATQHIGITARDYEVLASSVELCSPTDPSRKVLDFIKQHEVIAEIDIIKCRHRQIFIPLFKQLIVVEIEISEIPALQHKQCKNRFAHTARPVISLISGFCNSSSASYLVCRC